MEHDSDELSAWLAVLGGEEVRALGVDSGPVIMVASIAESRSLGNIGLFKGDPMNCRGNWDSVARAEKASLS